MQNGMHTAHFEAMCVAAPSPLGSAANHGSSASANDGDAAFAFQSCSNLVCASGMTTGGDHWVPASSSLSTLTTSRSLLSNGNPQQQTGITNCDTESFRDFEVPEGETNASSSLSPHDSGSCSFALKEHDYIGLSSDSSCAEGSQFNPRYTTDKYTGNAVHLDSKETELRLGCGPTDKSVVLLESARVDIAQSGTQLGSSSAGGNSELAIEKNAVSATASKGSTLQQVPHVVALEAGRLPRNARNELGVYVDSEGRIIADDTNLYSPRGLPKSFLSQETIRTWSREGYNEAGNLSTAGLPLISQCGLVSGSRIAEREFFLSQGRVASEVQGQDINHHEKEQSVSRQRIVAQHGSVLDNQYNKDSGINKSQHPEGPMKDTYGQETLNQLGPYQHVTESAADRHRDFSRDHGNLFSSFNFPPRDEKSSANPVSSVPPKYWQLPIFRPPDLQSTQSGTLEYGKASSLSNTAGFPAVRLSFPGPKVTVPAKRGFLEAIGPTIESRPGYSIENRSTPMELCGNGLSPSNIASCTEGETKSNLQTVNHQSSPTSYSWNSIFQVPGNLQKGFAAASNCGGDIFSATKDFRMRPPSDKECTRQPRQSNHDSQQDINPVDDNGTSARAPVGWPPIRSFRKNSLTANAKPNSEDDADPDGPLLMNRPDASTLYVKVNMDGVPIGRKLDLKAYNCYGNLKLALQDMFQQFLSGHNNGDPKSSGEECKQLNLLEGMEYVLTHEDKDGDWMLVGDVPWEMFVSTVKRLRIMKACDANGLGQRLLPKLKCTENI